MKFSPPTRAAWTVMWSFPTFLFVLVGLATIDYDTWTADLIQGAILLGCFAGVARAAYVAGTVSDVARRAFLDYLDRENP